LANVHILSQTPAFIPLQRHRKSTVGVAAKSTTTKIRLSDDTIGITIINTKTKAALEAANEHLLATFTLVVIRAIYFYVAT
jgi:hypothetical protein